MGGSIVLIWLFAQTPRICSHLHHRQHTHSHSTLTVVAVTMTHGTLHRSFCFTKESSQLYKRKPHEICTYDCCVGKPTNLSRFLCTWNPCGNRLLWLVWVSMSSITRCILGCKVDQMNHACHQYGSVWGLQPCAMNREWCVSEKWYAACEMFFVRPSK